MAFLGSPPQSYWPTQFVTDPSFGSDLDAGGPVGVLHDHGQTPQHHLSHPHHHHGHTTGDPNDPHGHPPQMAMDPALTDEIPPPHQAQHPIIFHQTSSHGYGTPFDPALSSADQIYPGRIRGGSKDMAAHNGEQLMLDGGHAFVAPPQHAYMNGMHHAEMQPPMGQPAQIKFRATTHTSSNSGGPGRRPKMTKDEQMARRRLRTDTDEYRTQERERMRRRRAREKEERDKAKKEQEDLLRAQGKESWIAPSSASKRKHVKNVKKRPTVGNAGDEISATENDDTLRETKRQAKVDSRAANSKAEGIDESVEPSNARITEEPSINDEDMVDPALEDLTNSSLEEDEDDDPEEELGEDEEDDGDVDDNDTPEKRELKTRISARRAAKAVPSTPSPTIRSSRTVELKQSTPKFTSAPGRLNRSSRSHSDQKKIHEVAATRSSSRTTRSTATTPAKSSTKESSTASSTAPAKTSGRRHVSTATNTPNSVVKTRVSTKTLAANAVSTGTPTPTTEAKSPTSGRAEGKGVATGPPVVMLFGYPAGVNPACDVSAVSVTVESTKTNKICMMTADDMRRPASPNNEVNGETNPSKEADIEKEDKMDVDTEAEGKQDEKMDDQKEGNEEQKTTEPNEDKVDDDSKPEEAIQIEVDNSEAISEAKLVDAPDKKMSESTPPQQQQRSISPVSTAAGVSNGTSVNNGRFSWDLVIQMLKQDIGFDPATDELVGFHHKDPLVLTCDRHINTAMVMAAKEGVRMPKWYVYRRDA